MKGIFHPDKRYDWEDPWIPYEDIRELDPVEDRHYLEYLLLHPRFRFRNRLMKKLGISELPEKKIDYEDLSDDSYEVYSILREQVAREPDAEVLKEAVYEAPSQMARFAFCYLTKYSYPAPWQYDYRYLTYECGWKEGMTTEDVVEFCQEMITVRGPFFREAGEILADPPKDHNDHSGKRMVSHERPVSEPPYVRKQRVAPFRESAEYEQSRAEILLQETRGLQMLAEDDRENAAWAFIEMKRKSRELGQYTQRWDAIDDCARSLIGVAESCYDDDSAVEAAYVLKRLIRECPEENAYREQLKKAEAVYRKAVEYLASKFGYAEEESPLVFYHSFEPEYTGIICRLIEEGFRERGGKREIKFRRLDVSCGQPAGNVDIYCLDLPTLKSLYALFGHDHIEADAILPFIDTENVFPALLQQITIKEEVRALPVLVFARAGAETPFFALMSHSLKGTRILERLDLIKLMTDSEFLYDVCKACNIGKQTPHVFPADRIAYARLAKEDPRYPREINERCNNCGRKETH